MHGILISHDPNLAPLIGLGRCMFTHVITPEYVIKRHKYEWVEVEVSSPQSSGVLYHTFS